MEKKLRPTPCVFWTEIKFLMKSSLTSVMNYRRASHRRKNRRSCGAVLQNSGGSGKKRPVLCFCDPIAKEVDLKAAARAVGEKSVSMIHVKDITSVTGYMRGGCSPLGMKKQFPTVIHSDALKFDRVWISGGRIGTSICLDPQDLIRVTRRKRRIFLWRRAETRDLV